MQGMKKLLIMTLCAALVVSSLAACGKSQENVPKATGQEESATTSETKTEESAAPVAKNLGQIKSLERPSFGGELDCDVYDPSVKPSVAEYKVEPDFSNVINRDSELNEYTEEAFKEKLLKNYFVVGEENGREFFETYEFNSYSQTPNFVTVDAMMHTYHLYFAHLLKLTEKTYLSDMLADVSEDMYAESMIWHDNLVGTEWEEAASRNVAYFAVALSLIGRPAEVPDYAKALADEEIALVNDATALQESPLTGIYEDYTQYKPRGYYEGDEQLEKYFKTMMWYGRITFEQESEVLNRAALLMTLAMNGNAFDDWESIYEVTSFFAGASDDPGYYEYMPVIEAAYGSRDLTQEDLVGDDVAYRSYEEAIKKLPAPQIQSIPVFDFEETNVVPGFRFMGQRFTVDANIMQNLIFRAVGANEKEEQRMLPDVLDVPAALGSEKAFEITSELGADKWPDYAKNMKEMRKNIENAPDSLWSASLYAGWLNTLRPILDVKGEGYPMFMQNEDWTKKDLETFAGSYTELKHDTVLYAKQPMAEMGGGWEEDIDDRGYVQPEPLVFARFASLARTTEKGLKDLCVISRDDMKNLELLAEMADKLVVISQKELQNELPTDEEFEFIRNFGGDIEHFWYEAVKPDNPDDEFFGVTSEEYPAALVVDVATDPNGYVLEAGCGNPRAIYVIVPVDGILRIAEGSVYNFYQFEQPITDRMTDSVWREKIGAMPGEGFLYDRDESYQNPEWTMSYREDKWNWENHQDDYD